jgi:hypothetical protein
MPNYQYIFSPSKIIMSLFALNRLFFLARGYFYNITVITLFALILWSFSCIFCSFFFINSQNILQLCREQYFWLALCVLFLWKFSHYGVFRARRVSYCYYSQWSKFSLRNLWHKKIEKAKKFIQLFHKKIWYFYRFLMTMDESCGSVHSIDFLF